MRISDWSSDVCSSDLSQLARGLSLAGPQLRLVARCADNLHRQQAAAQLVAVVHARGVLLPDIAALGKADAVQLHRIRSEEHTSELQSLMRISYAVFCLKKKHT